MSIKGDKCPYCDSEVVEGFSKSIEFDDDTNTFKSPNECLNCGLEFYTVFEYSHKGFERMFSDWNAEYRQNGVCVCLTFCDEGLNGDYIEDDPDDVPLLRFSVYVYDEETKGYNAVDDGSYCTMVPRNVSDDVGRNACEFIHEKVVGLVLEGSSIKKIGEDLSNIDSSQFSRVAQCNAVPPLKRNV